MLLPSNLVSWKKQGTLSTCSWPRAIIPGGEQAHPLPAPPTLFGHTTERGAASVGSICCPSPGDQARQQELIWANHKPLSGQYGTSGVPIETTLMGAPAARRDVTIHHTSCIRNQWWMGQPPALRAKMECAMGCVCEGGHGVCVRGWEANIGGSECQPGLGRASAGSATVLVVRWKKTPPPKAGFRKGSLELQDSLETI